jgi:hypothetical protein
MYYRHINNGKGPIKLIIGGIHGKEGKTTIDLIKLLKKEDFAPGQIYIYNLNISPYISTINKNFYDSKQGKKIINLIKKHKPDFYTELHCYNISHFTKLISDSRFEIQGVPPLIDCGDYVLVSSVSPLIRFKYFSKETVCKTIEIPSFNSENFDLKKVKNKYNFDKQLSINKAMDLLYLITKSNNRIEYERNITLKYPKQVNLAIYYVKEMFGENFSPY